MLHEARSFMVYCDKCGQHLMQRNTSLPLAYTTSDKEDLENELLFQRWGTDGHRHTCNFCGASATATEGGVRGGDNEKS